MRPDFFLTAASASVGRDQLTRFDIKLFFLVQLPLMVAVATQRIALVLFLQ